MRRLTAVESITLDGVMQAPGRPDEDNRNGFTHGGWAAPFADPVLGETMGRHMATESELLFGRRTYDDFAGFWPHQTDNPFTPVLNARAKHVVTNSRSGPLPWQNSHALPGDPTDSVRTLKEHDGPDLVVLGSGQLARTLLTVQLIDELILLTHPLALGSGQQLFDGSGDRLDFELTDTVPTTTGVIIATYHLTPTS